MSSQEQLIEDALIFTKGQGIAIRGGGAVFDWQKYDPINGSQWLDKPAACNAIGAILLFLGKESFVKDSFNPEWIKIVSSYLNEEPFWINRFVLGFDYSAKVNVIKTSKDKTESVEQDKASLLGIKLANKYCRK